MRLFPVEEAEVGSRFDGLFSSLTPEWATPQGLFDQLDREFGFTLDPCSTDDNAKCLKHYTRREDGLSQSWAGERVFMNPPYGTELPFWIAKAHREEALVVALIPSRTDTAWWHNHVMQADEIRFIRGRVRFDGSAKDAPFPSAIVVWAAPRTEGGPE